MPCVHSIRSTTHVVSIPVFPVLDRNGSRLAYARTNELGDLLPPTPPRCNMVGEGRGRQRRLFPYPACQCCATTARRLAGCSNFINARGVDDFEGH